MTITIDIRRVLFMSFIGTFLVLALGLAAGCGAYSSNARSRSTMEVDDGVHPPRRITVSHEGNAGGASVGLPIVAGASGAYGYGTPGYGYPVVGGGNLCMVHPDYCGTVVTIQSTAYTAPVPRQGTEPGLEKRVSDLEKKSEVNRQVLIRDHKNRKVIVGYLGSALVLNRQSCGYITANPESLVIEDEPELTKTVRAEVLTKCAGIVGEKENN